MVKEVVDVILNQIDTTKARANVKAVLLVGGFGQNVYLRDRVRAAVVALKLCNHETGELFETNNLKCLQVLH